MSTRGDDLMLETLRHCREILTNGASTNEECAGAFRLAADLGKTDDNAPIAEFRHAARILDDLERLKRLAVQRFDASIKWRTPGDPS